MEYRKKRLINTGEVEREVEHPVVRAMNVEEAVTKELEPSELGTKEHWDNAYKEELEHYEADGVPGEDWFGPRIKTTIVEFLKKSLDLKSDVKIIDLGCGCGPVLTALNEAGFSNLTGVDYSENAVELCRAVCQDNGFAANIKVFDLVDGPIDELGTYDVCIDKGTYDAISLIPSSSQTQARNKYLDNVVSLMTGDSIFILASCNWTMAELTSQTLNRFTVVGDVPTRKFSFGGKTGNDVSILVLKKSE
ncbi:unnamed protein product [Allacma fusca]|uniref:Protein-lysine N-methyltransferase AFUS01_LOCUS17604 n=1 Tax=Allacma fusca TaxID=39272 RepID=A0A8J2K653_9HEXA|nr:unnamed protein product [Allacma fusca]